MPRLFFDSHMHTPLCKHAVGEPELYAERALAMGLKGIIFTCHSPMPRGFWPRVRMAMDEFDEYLRMVQRAADAFAGQLEIRLGMESDYFPGFEDWIAELHQKAAFHHCLGSVHYQGKEYQERFATDNRRDFRCAYFKHLADSAETGLFDTLAHPDLVKNWFPQYWEFGEYVDVIAESLDRIAKTGVAMELNTSGLNKNISEMNPGPEMLAMMCERGIPVVLGSDSHSPRRVAENFDIALGQLTSAGYDKVSVFRLRQREEFQIADVLASLSVASVKTVV
jgi:histidinol-phosphatase (PHP family)